MFKLPLLEVVDELLIFLSVIAVPLVFFTKSMLGSSVEKVISKSPSKRL
jgi:hypothetical protein